MEENEGKSKAGAPTKFKDEYIEQGYKLTLLGYKDKELADFWGVDERTINNWKKDEDGNETEFFQSIKKGKELADTEVVSSLYKRAKGYEYKEVTEEMGVETKVVHKVQAPDTAACLIWLKNRQPATWRDKQEIDHTSKGKAIQPRITFTTGRDE